MGKTLTWEDENVPPFPIDSFAYELGTRNEIITMKEIKPTDVAFVIPRYNWKINTVYDQYDDQYDNQYTSYQASLIIDNSEINTFGSI